ncbi:ribonuclease H-like domain-containing protein [Candidatus Woesearchaeota archaeon]|nr:ribonuclease H-like domain-containing protein [Candidatus Woesearchaeota archaeon]
MEKYLILDIETCPIDLPEYEKLDEEERKKLLNPIDCKIIAIGMRSQGENNIFLDEDEKTMLISFWEKFSELRQSGTLIIGFNLLPFDIPFLITRSFINNVPIVPFTIKYVVDLREKITAYRHQPSRGTLKDFAAAMGLENLGDGSQVPFLCKDKAWEKLKQYLQHDLVITDTMYQRLKELHILDIQRY